MKKGVKKLQGLGDSKLVIDWAKKKSTVADLRLGPLPKDIADAFHSFEWISFRHIYKELNAKADAKEALSLPVGAIRFYEFNDGEEIESMELQF